MSHQYANQNQVPVAYPAPPVSTYVMAPPPIGYPTKEEVGNNQVDIPIVTKSRGDGFLKGCLAGLCCCCCLDFCF